MCRGFRRRCAALSLQILADPVTMSQRRHSVKDSKISRDLSFRGVALIATAVGAVAVGAFAIGALAIGRLTVRRILVGSAELKSLEIGELTVKRLRAGQVIVDDSLSLPEGADNRISS